MADLITDDEKIEEISRLQLDRMLADARRYANEPMRLNEPSHVEHLAWIIPIACMLAMLLIVCGVVALAYSKG